MVFIAPQWAFLVCYLFISLSKEAFLIALRNILSSCEYLVSIYFHIFFSYAAIYINHSNRIGNPNSSVGIVNLQGVIRSGVLIPVKTVDFL